VDAGGGVTPSLAFLGDFGNAVRFLFESRVPEKGAQPVGGSHLLPLIGEHLQVSLAAMAIACALAIPVGVWLGHIGKGEFVAVSVSNIGRAIPSFALIVFFFAFIGAGFLNVTIALALLAIPPILTNSYVGTRQVDPEAVDAARGMGMREEQIASRVELPLALPLIFGGVRTSAVNVIATATLASIVGLNTLGDPIFSPNIYGTDGQLAGALLVALLALASEGVLGTAQRLLTPSGLKVGRQGSSRRRSIPLIKRRMEGIS
jgi:osmoprotectant transport system permease protein